MASSDSQIDKPQRGRPKRAELPDVNINTGAQSINTEGASLDLAQEETTVLLISMVGIVNQREVLLNFALDITKQF